MKIVKLVFLSACWVFITIFLSLAWSYEAQPWPVFSTAAWFLVSWELYKMGKEVLNTRSKKETRQ